MKFYDLPYDMQEDVKKLASQHSITINEVLEYYMIDGYEHADKLCLLRDAEYPSNVVKLYSYILQKEKIKNIILKELNKLS